MNSKTTGYVILGVIGTITAGLIAGGWYYATPSNDLAPTGRSNYFGNQYGGKKSRKQSRHGRRTRRR